MKTNTPKQKKQLKDFLKGHPDYQENKEAINGWLSVALSEDAVFGFEPGFIPKEMKGKTIETFSFSGNYEEVKKKMEETDFSGYDKASFAFDLTEKGSTLQKARGLLKSANFDPGAIIEWNIRTRDDMDKDFIFALCPKEERGEDK